MNEFKCVGVCDAAPAAGGLTHGHYMGRVSPPYQLPGEAMQWVTDIRTCAKTDGKNRVHMKLCYM